MYNWKKNKGYPTKEHREAIRKYGVTKYHRMSFRLLPEQLKLDLMILDFRFRCYYFRIVNHHDFFNKFASNKIRKMF